MGMINEHIELQKRLMDAVGAKYSDEVELKRLLLITVLALIDEGLEVVDYEKDSTKPWKSPSFDKLLIKEEVIDIWHFVLQLFALLDMNENEVDAMYRWKNQRNFERIKVKMNAVTN